MIRVLIGARGTGKTSLLKRLQFYIGSTDVEFFDLDKEIESASGHLIEEIFSKFGEAEFRRRENEQFKLLIAVPEDKLRIISVGAGFDLGQIPHGTEVVWVMRDSDEFGRIFLDRPRLNLELSPMEEYLHKWNERRLNYLIFANQYYLMPEGLHAPNLIEKQILCDDLQNIGGVITAMPSEIGEPSELVGWINQWLARGVTFVELRDDLYSFEQISEVLKKVNTDRILYSVRSIGSAAKALELIQELELVWDWALELGPPPDVELSIVSDHSSRSAEQVLKKTLQFEKSGVHIKWSPEVNTWKETEEAYYWQAQAPAQRSLLPRSSKGSLKWLRLFLKDKQGLNFWREGFGSALDQPSLFEWYSHPSQAQEFAAVLGSPVKLSWTPVTQANFFNDWNMPVYAIDILGGEFDIAISFLTKLGLKAAAVTSPLKKLMYDLIVNGGGELSPEASRLQSVNSVWFNSQKIFGHNTDLAGFSELVKDIDHSLSIAIWGGGGTQAVIAEVLPNAGFYGSTSGDLKTGKALQQVDVVIWAAPRGDRLQFPPPHWRPKLVIDINYIESSGGREYAAMVKCQYRSGAAMFFEQAKWQREFWTNFLEN